MNSTNNRRPVPQSDRDKLKRNVLIWLNTFPEKPVKRIVTVSHLEIDKPGMAMSSITSAYINHHDILGGYDADCLFEVIYRIKSVNVDQSLQADELLDRLGDWACQKLPNLGEGIQAARVMPTSQAELLYPYENGWEDHHILMKLTFEVM